MRRLIIGYGYLGERVAPLWRDSNPLYATTRRPEQAQRLRERGIEPVLCDVLDPGELPAVDTVLYCVGFDRASGKSMREVYVDGLSRMLNRLPKPKRFIYVSSTSVYGQDDESWIDEGSPTEPQEESGRIVLAAEGIVREKFPEATILRFAGIYGPGRLLRQKSIQSGEVIVADASKWLNLIHVADGARAVVAAEGLATPGQVINVADGQPVRRRDFYGELARVLGAPEPRYEMPKPPLPPHEKGNRRIGNRRMCETLGAPTVTNYLSGITSSRG